MWYWTGIENFVIIGCSERKGCDLCFINEPSSCEMRMILGQIVILIARKRHIKMAWLKISLRKTIQQIWLRTWCVFKPLCSAQLLWQPQMTSPHWLRFRSRWTETLKQQDPSLRSREPPDQSPINKASEGPWACIIQLMQVDSPPQRWSCSTSGQNEKAELNKRF